MPFIAYVAIVLVSLTGILFELDWLTKPKQDTKAAAPIVASSTAVPPRVVAKVDGPNQGPTPLRGKQDADTTQAAAPAVTVGATPASTAAGTAPPVSPSPEFGATQAAAAPQTNAQTTELATQLAVPAASAATSAPAQATVVPASTPAKPDQAATLQAASAQAPNHCDVAGCSAAYQSFRASDCSYQPMEGPRKFCEKPPQGGQIAATPRAPKVGAAARRSSKDAELRDAERAVRRITAGDDADIDPRMGRSEVIVIERPERDW